MLVGLINKLRPIWRWMENHPVLSSVVILIVIRLLISYWMLSLYLGQYGYVVLSADDTTRGALAYIFWHHPFIFPPSHFLPLHSYIAGLLIGLMSDIHNACVTTSLLFGILALIMGFLVGRKLAGTLGGWVTALLLLVEPFPFWVSFSGGLTDTIFYAVTLAGLLVMLYLREKPQLIWLGCIIFLLASMTRYEFLSYGAVFTAVVMWQVIKGRIKWWIALLALAIIPLFQVGVLVKSYLETGNPLAIVDNYASGMYSDSKAILADSTLAHLLFPFRVLWQDNSLMVWLLPLGFFWALWERKQSALSALYCLAGFAMLFYIVQTKGGGFAPNRYFAQVYITAYPFVAAMLVAAYRWLKTRWRAGYLFHSLPFVVVFVQLSTSWARVQTLTISFNNYGVGMSRPTYTTGKIFQNLWKAQILPNNELILIEQKVHELYGIPYFSNRPTQFQAFIDTYEGGPTDPTLELLNRELASREYSAAILLTPELINRYRNNMGTYNRLSYSFLYGEKPNEILLVFPPDLPLFTELFASDANGKPTRHYQKGGMSLPLEDIWQDYPLGTLLFGEISFLARNSQLEVDFTKRQLALLVPAPDITLEGKGAIGWLLNSNRVPLDSTESLVRLEGENQAKLECWIPVTRRDIAHRQMELKIKVNEVKGNVKVDLLMELGREYPYPNYNAQMEQIITGTNPMREGEKADKSTPKTSDAYLKPGEYTIRLKPNDIQNHKGTGFDMTNVEMIHISLSIQTMGPDAMLSFDFLGWKYSLTGE